MHEQRNSQSIENNNLINIHKITQNSSDQAKNRKTAQFIVSSQISESQYQLKKNFQSSILDVQQEAVNLIAKFKHFQQNYIARIEILEMEMKTLIEKNSELQQIVKFFQANLSRLHLQIESDLSIALQTMKGGSIYQKRPIQNEYQFQDQSRNQSYGTDNDYLSHIRKDQARNDMNYLGSIEEEEIQQNKDSMVELTRPDILQQQPLQKSNYHEDLMRNIELQINKVFKLIHQKVQFNAKLNTSIEDRKRDTIGSKKGNIFNGSRRSQTPHQFERGKLLLRDSFNNGGANGSVSGFNQQYFVNNHQFGGTSGVRQSNASQRNIHNNFGMSPNSPTMQNILNNDNQANQIYYATSEVSRDENNDNSGHHFKNKNNSNNKINIKGVFQADQTNQSRASQQNKHRSNNPKIMMQSQSHLVLNTEMPSFQEISANVTKNYNSHDRSGMQSYYAQMQNLDQTQGSMPIFDEPMKWTPNERSQNCQICMKIFNIFRRKHHCRGCGILICARCSPEKGYVPGYKDKKVRICKNCDITKQRRKTETGKLNVFTSAKTIQNQRKK